MPNFTLHCGGHLKYQKNMLNFVVPAKMSKPLRVVNTSAKKCTLVIYRKISYLKQIIQVYNIKRITTIYPKK